MPKPMKKKQKRLTLGGNNDLDFYRDILEQEMLDSKSDYERELGIKILSLINSHRRSKHNVHFEILDIHTSEEEHSMYFACNPNINVFEKTTLYYSMASMVFASTLFYYARKCQRDLNKIRHLIERSLFSIRDKHKPTDDILLSYNHQDRLLRIHRFADGKGTALSKKNDDFQFLIDSEVGPEAFDISDN